MVNPVNTAGITNRVNPIRRLIAVNGSAGAYVLVSASQGSFGYVEITEAPSEPYTGTFTAQGINYQRADENYANTYPLPPGGILQIGDAIKKDGHVGISSFTYPDGVVRPATPYVKVLSATATATAIQISEWRQEGSG